MSVILILGAGPGIGQNVARAFATKGYKVATVSRKPKDDNSANLNVTADLSNPEAIAGVFEQVKASLGIPSVVVYNAGGATMNDAKDPLSLSLKDFARDLNVNTVSAFVAAQQAAEGFKQLSGDASRTFIFTGNFLNTTIMAPLMDLGVGKSATAHIIQSAAAAYKDQGFKFYYADERKPTGAPAFRDLDGPAHADFYDQLAETSSQGPWQQTFVKGQGYTYFPVSE